MKKIFLLAVTFIMSVIAANAQYNKIVAKDGTGDYATVQASIDAAPTNSATPWVIYIKNGKYYEKVNIPSNKPNIQLIGESVGNVMVYYDDYAGKPIAGGGTLGTQNSASVTINANDFVAVNITFANTFNYDSAAAAGVSGTQAVAVTINADRSAFKNCRFIGMQDTLYTKGSGTPRHYFYKCYIDGIVDFIFGSSVAIFDSCVIYPKARTGTGSSYITAANTTIGQTYGYWFKDCKIPSNTGATLYYLGRPWGNSNSSVTSNSKTVFFNSSMGSSVNPLGWSVWDATTNTSVITYAEYKSKKLDGNLLDISNRVSWSKQFADVDTVGYNILNVFNGWNPCSVRADFCSSPTTELVVSNFKGVKSGANANFSWNASWAITGVTYELYKSTNNKASFNVLSSSVATNDTAINFSGTDALPPAGSSYYYFVKASLAGSNAYYTDTVAISSIPTINTTTSSLTNFLQGSTAPSGSQTYIVSGVNLLNDITIAAPANYEVSKDGTNWFNSTTPLILTPSAGNIANTIIYVRLNAASAGTYSGDIVHSTIGVSTTHTKLVSVNGTTQSTPLLSYELIQQWDLTSDNNDNPTIKIPRVAEATVPKFNKLYLSNGTQVSSIPAYSTQFGQAFGATANGDGTWSTATGGPGGNLNRTYYEEFTIKPASNALMLEVDSIVLTTAFYNTSSNIKLAVVYSKSNFTADSANVTGGRDGSGLTLAGSANGGFTTPIVLSNQTSGPTASYALALNAGTGVSIMYGDSLKIRLYYSCGSGSAGRYAMLKNVQIKGLSQLLPLNFVNYQIKLKNENQVENTWQTANEINVSHYNIQRSINNKDFVSIGSVDAKGNGEYSFRDEVNASLLSPSIYYRIESIDKDGKKQYSETKKIVFNPKNIAINIHPNPSKNQIQISYKQSIKDRNIKIVDMQGKIVKEVKVTGGTEHSTINIQQLQKGCYIVSLDDEKTMLIKE